MAKTKFEIYKDNKGNYRWRLLAQNGEPVASSGEGFSEKRTAMNAVKKLKDWANTTNILDIEKIKEDSIKAKAKSIADAKKTTTKATVKKVVKKVIAKKVNTKAATKKTVTKAAVKKVAKKGIAKAASSQENNTPTVL